MAQTVLISGADGALGSAASTAFSRRGWSVVATAHNESKREQLVALGVDRVFVGDIRDSETVKTCISTITQLDALICLIGGIQAGKSVENTEPEILQTMLDLNVRTAYNLMHHCMPLLRRQGGSIVCVGARSALQPQANRAAYSAAKAALIALTLSVAEEGRADNVRANVIVPDVIYTPSNLEWASNGEERRWLHPEDLAESMYQLCQPLMSSVNGAVLPMYGGAERNH